MIIEINEDKKCIQNCIIDAVRIIDGFEKFMTEGPASRPLLTFCNWVILHNEIEQIVRLWKSNKTRSELLRESLSSTSERQRSS